MLGKQLQGQPLPRSHRPALVVYVPETGPRFPEAPLLHPLALGGRMGRGAGASRGSRGDGGAGNGGLYPIGRWSRCRRLLVGTGGGWRRCRWFILGTGTMEDISVAPCGRCREGVVAVSGQVTCPRQLSEAVRRPESRAGEAGLGEQGPGRAGPPPGGDMGVVAGPVVACLAQGLGPVLVARRRPRCPQLWGGRGGR